MSSSFNFVVDTDPMARSIGTVSSHVDATTGAVVAMKVAVIKAEKDAADHVCENVNRGFYSLIRSQISQKMAKLQSDVDTLLMQLNQQTKQLNGIRSRMERDYNMISRRYYKIFSSINRNLEQRVHDLDRPAFDFARRDMGQISNRPQLLTATVPVVNNESVRQSQRIIASNIKYRGLNVVHSIRQFLHNSAELQKITSRILLRGNMPEAKRTVYMPVVMCESRLDAFDNRSTLLYVSDEGVADRNARTGITNAVAARLDNSQWSEPQPPSAAIAGEVASMFASDMNLSPRVRETAMRLFAGASYQTSTSQSAR